MVTLYKTVPPTDQNRLGVGRLLDMPGTHDSLWSTFPANFSFLSDRTFQKDTDTYFADMIVG